MSRNHCDISGDPARTVPEKRRVPKQATRGIQNTKVLRIKGQHERNQNIAREDRR